MQKTIIEDKERQITWEPGCVIFYSKANDNKISIDVEDLICTDQHDKASLDMLKEANLEPSDYRQMTVHEKNPVLLETKIAEKVLSDAKAYQTKRVMDQLQELYGNEIIREKKEVYQLLKKAEQVELSGSEDDAWLIASLRNQANGLFDKWREKHPDRAIERDIDELEDRARQIRDSVFYTLFYKDKEDEKVKRKINREAIRKEEAIKVKIKKLKKKLVECDAKMARR